LKKRLLQAEIENKDLFLLKGRKTTLKTRVLSKNRQLIRIDSEDLKLIEHQTAELLLDRIKFIIEQEAIDTVLLQDYNKGMLTPVLIENIISLCREKKIPVIVDPKEDHIEAFKGCTLFKPNLKEVEKIIGKAVNPLSLNQLEKAAVHLFKLLECEIVVITLSEHGIFYAIKNGDNQVIRQDSMQVADVSGAGDTVIACIAVGMASGMEVASFVKLANAAAGYVCSKLTVVPIDKVALDGLVL